MRLIYLLSVGQKQERIPLVACFSEIEPEADTIEIILLFKPFTSESASLICLTHEG